MSGSNLRRSSRKLKQEEFTAGMIVEITRNRTRSKGRLVSKLTDASSSNPRWLVAFDEESLPEEDIYESYFGKIIEKVHYNNGIKARRATSATSKEAKKSAATTTSKTSTTGPPNNDVIPSRQRKKSAKSPPTTPTELAKVSSDTTEEISVSSDSKKTQNDGYRRGREIG
mmetsp:Transcript_11247/g.21457  ORF Transcript_11247/g.21457 Transcript_11247/m.21457 type:complete len:170 (-) Transcript_11247:302-811(-)